MPAPVVWFEIAGRDLDARSRLYGDLLGWKVDADNPSATGWSTAALRAASRARPTQPG